MVDEIDVNEAHLPELYKTCAYASRFNYDYALLTVTEDLSDYEHFNLGELISGTTLTSVPVNVSGFPGSDTNIEDDVVITPGNLYIGSGYPTNLTDYCIRYSADTSGGQSGGPVFVTTRYQLGSDAAVEKRTVIAIHTLGGSTNGGTRVTSELLKFYLNNSYNTYEE